MVDPIRAVTLVLTLLVPSTLFPAASIPTSQPSPELLERARSEEKPLLVFFAAEKCPDHRAKIEPCGQLQGMLRHPLTERRLKNVLHVTIPPPTNEEARVAVYAPDGRTAITWGGIPSPSTLVKILTNLDMATPHILDAWRASTAGDASTELRETALATLALGNEHRGRELLKSLAESSVEEDRQLALIWLTQLDTNEGDDSAKKLRDLMIHGATRLVRFEAAMALGRRLLAEGDNEGAILAFQAAMDASSDSPEGRRAAFAAYQRASIPANAVLGLGVPGAIVAGRRTIQPRSVEPEAVSVEYRLDGAPVARSSTRPFAAAVNFGRLPTRQTLEIVQRSKTDTVVQSSTMVINQSPSSFSVRIVKPAPATLSGPIDVEIAVGVPDGRTVEEVVVEWKDRRVARLSAPPYETSFPVARDEQGILTASVRLDDGSELEDVKVVNAGTMTMDAQVHLVELPVDLDRPVRRETITVKENGVGRPVERVIAPGDAPLLVGLLIDSSSSMGAGILDHGVPVRLIEAVQEAALRFVEESLDPADRVMVVGFDTSLRILWPTSDRSTIERAILALHPRGNTSLYDAMVDALLQLQTRGSRRALIVFTDGMDNSSRFSSDDVAALARRSGVPIYLIAQAPLARARVTSTSMPVLSDAELVRRTQMTLAKMSHSTGGQGHLVRSLEKLHSVWTAIGADLGKQWLVAYRPAASGDDWRSLEVFSGARRLRAPSGVQVAEESMEEGEGQ